MSVSDIYETIVEALKIPLDYFINPEKRVYYLYLLSSLGLAYYVYLKIKPNKSFFKYVFDRKIYLCKSAYTDYGIMFINGFIKILFIAPFLVLGLRIAFDTREFMVNIFGYPKFSLGLYSTIILYTITITLIGDFVSYLAHYLMHIIPFLWAFHKVHHSATEMNPLTQYRLHPVELIIHNVNGILVFGFTTGLFDYLSSHKIDKITFLGVNIFAFLFMFFGANLRHSHIPLKYPRFLEFILISPYQHQIHHSNNPSHYNKNMGAKFAIWDWMFGTLCLSKSVDKISFGLGGREDAKFDDFLKNLYMPFKQAFLVIKNRTKFGL